MTTEITLLSDDALDAVSGGVQNNGVGQTQYAHKGAGALPLTGDAGSGNNGDGPFVLSVAGVLGLMIHGAAVVAAA